MMKSVSTSQVVHNCDNCGLEQIVPVDKIVTGDNAGRYTVFPPCNGCGAVRCNNVDTVPENHTDYSHGNHPEHVMDHIHVQALEAVLHGEDHAGVYAKHGVS